MTPALRARLEKLFDAGHTIDGAHKAVCAKKKISRALVGFVHREWAQRRSGESQAADAQTTADSETPTAVHPEAEAQQEPQQQTPSPTIVSTSVQDARAVQHAGVWLLLGLLASWGLYESALKAAAAGRRLGTEALRIAIDASVAALALGEGCVEGVRRLATPTAALLLRTRRCPSAAWVRTTLCQAAMDGGGLRFHIDIASHFVVEASSRTAAQRPVVFYIDNHMRPYTGKHKVRKGWRMQDRRARPGCTDYYIHDEDGRPLMRIDVPHHGSLTQWLLPLAQGLREALGPEERILLAFDRGGSFASQLTELRDADFEFVTYERKPYSQLRFGAFDKEIRDGGEQILVSDKRTNLGKGRGRVRRIALLMPTGNQINLLANGGVDAESLYRIARGRWRQENGFKHGNERWGINQLDGRTTEPVPPEEVIPNPARRRLERALRVVRQDEGKLRCELAASARGSSKREAIERRLEEAIARRRELEALRPSTPHKAPVKDTELAGKLVRHVGDYKMWLDTLRVACANAESELAGRLAPHLARPAEAKKVLANLLTAPADVEVSRTRVTLTLRPAASPREREAMSEFLRECSAMNLRLPGDTDGRTLAFRLQD
jgi:hypothetical protein